ncbi:MAG TPA: hypothetical protein VHV29_09935 [Terriglobales bacterium]|jgi:hypothetical protein|nr:hypothetical protein [Terriglobales bacterium]
MKRKYIDRIGAAFGIGVISALLYHLLGWLGVAGLALVELGEITFKLAEIAERLEKLSAL